MELWIRSQDREKLIKIDMYLHYEFKNEEHTINECGEIVAVYNSKERALEVLDEIMKLLKDEEILHIRKSSLNNLDEMEEPKYILKPVGQPRIYEMPLE